MSPGTQPRYPDLAGKVALVTGGSKGIGAATCRALAANGARVAVNGRDPAAVEALVRAIEEAGGTAVAAPGDATDEDALRRVRETVERAFGPVELLAAFTGGKGAPAPVVELGPERWREVIETDLTSVYLALHTFLPAMYDRGAGAVVTMSSSAGRGPSGANAAYAAAKAGVSMLTTHLAAELGRHGVRVNCLAPSAVLVERMRQAMPPERLAEMAASYPLGRAGSPEDVAQAALYLLSDASSWVTGTTLDLTGGRGAA
ncbi:3-oxoacyl-ACP reductase FabG [Nonomuraea roseoviolacea subsp. roseoviolacea]|uniref:SDR family NAD(P)-dependent oxidoreductase n=1 Tax=Nonomuraea roseoviolacea TaxID=103837 RepID=UPI0031E1BFCA